ncbi:hypothetical protein LEP1GSC186_3454 [Leptospira noguchii serovar Autumnalis str. ZUN142]|uniref:Uncharacterized protein n=1 Tax=Leptospira noguchii serovar Autumnalis str. ZUN142 TaxID=1085540 RepID=M6UFI2_9LEPT|nr:hypothetical protein [Leptospira noguchii]EMO39839.1 hypothetical protein LEP1GSC186_3454 [Leptospira noguchii serovar Autumnalis str. ZUN142]
MPGLDRKTIASINFDKAVERILADVGSDFIYAPYLNFVCKLRPTTLRKVLARKIFRLRFPRLKKIS